MVARSHHAGEQLPLLLSCLNHRDVCHLSGQDHVSDQLRRGSPILTCDSLTGDASVDKEADCVTDLAEGLGPLKKTKQNPETDVTFIFVLCQSALSTCSGGVHKLKSALNSSEQL